MKPKDKSTRAIAPKITAEAAEWYEATFPTLNAGATFMLDSTPHLYAQTLHEMRGIFTRGELGMILDVLNGHGTVLVYMGHPSMVGQHLQLSIHDSFALYPGQYEETWDIPDPTSFLTRLAERSRWQLVCLEIWAASFWQQHETTNLNEYVGTLAGGGTPCTPPA